MSSYTGNDLTFEVNGLFEVLNSYCFPRPPSIYQERCDPAQVMSFGCRGQCRSYVEVDPHNPMQQQRHCRYVE